MARRVAGLVLSSLLLIVPSVTLGQDYDDPHSRPGRAAVNVYDDVPGGGTINIYNGAFELDIPIYSAQTNGRLNWQVAARYSSKNVNGLDPSPLGKGWNIQLGRVTGSGSAYHVHGPDGSVHALGRLGGNAGPADHYVSRDGSYLRAHYLSASDSFQVYWPDGVVAEYANHIADPFRPWKAGWHLTTVLDPFGNRLTVTYHGAPNEHLPLSLVDSDGREARFALVAWGGQLIGSADVPSIGGQRAIWTFRQRLVHGSILEAIEGPEGLRWNFEYDAEGLLSVVRLPTGGAISLTHAQYTHLGLPLGTGVASRKHFLNGDVLDNSPGNVAEWRYLRDQCIPCLCDPSESRFSVAVRTPDERWRIVYFARTPWDDVTATSGLAEEQVEFDRAFAELDSCWRPPPGVGVARRVRQKWEIDSFHGDTAIFNPRLTWQQVSVAGDPGASTRSSCGYNGLGSFTNEIMISTLGGYSVSELETRQLQQATCAWVLNLRTADGLFHEGVGRLVEHRFDAQGSLVKEVRHARPRTASTTCDRSGDPALTISAIGQTVEQSLLVPSSGWPTFTPLRSVIDPVPRCLPQSPLPLVVDPGDVIRDLTYYGDAGNDTHASWGAASTVTLSGGDAQVSGPPRVERLTWTAGEVKSMSVDRVGWPVLDRDVDSFTRVVTASRHPSRPALHFTYDALLRPTGAWHDPTLGLSPPHNSEARDVIEYSRDFRRITRTTWSPDDAEEPVRTSVTHLDGFGRTVRVDESRAPGVYATRVYTWDALDRRTFESDVVRTSGPDAVVAGPPGTVLSFEAGGAPDPLGRLRSELYSDGTTRLHDYAGTSHGERIRSATGDIVSTATARHDGLGRMRRLDGPAAGSVAEYDRDVHGAIRQIRITGPAGTQVRSFERDGLGLLRVTETPERGVVGDMLYDAMGSLRQASISDGRVRRWSRDDLGRVTAVTDTDPGSTVPLVLILHEYDDPSAGPYAVGRLTAMESKEGTTRVRNKMEFAGLGGRLSRLETVFDGQARLSFSQGYEYDATGAIVRVEYPHLTGQTPFVISQGVVGGIATFIGTPDQPKRYLRAADPSTAYGFARRTFGNGIVEVSTLGDRNRLESRTWLSPAGAEVIGTGLLGYEARGHVLTAGPAPGRPDTNVYYHDAEGRIFRSYISGGGIVTYSWDAHGNMSSRNWESRPLDCGRIGFLTHGMFSSREFFHAHGGMATVPTNRVSRSGSACPDEPYDYDMSGRQTSGGQHRVSFDRLDRARTIESAASGIVQRLGWDALGSLVSLDDTGGGPRSIFLRDGSGRPLSEWSVFSGIAGPVAVEKRRFVHHGATLLAIEDLQSDSTHWVSMDQVGTSLGLTDSSGSAVTRWRTEAFGLAMDTDAALSFAGHMRLGVEGLDVMGSRLYSPADGRFLSPDPVGQSGPSAGAWNAYAYAFGSPGAYIDPTGRKNEKNRSVPPTTGPGSQDRPFEETHEVTNEGTRRVESAGESHAYWMASFLFYDAIRQYNGLMPASCGTWQQRVEDAFRKGLVGERSWVGWGMIHHQSKYGVDASQHPLGLISDEWRPNHAANVVFPMDNPADTSQWVIYDAWDIDNNVNPQLVYQGLDSWLNSHPIVAGQWYMQPDPMEFRMQRIEQPGFTSVSIPLLPPGGFIP